MALVMDVFYDPNNKKAQVSLKLEHSVSVGYMHPLIQEFAKKWAEENDKIFSGTAETTKFSEFDRRWLWSTYGKVSDPEQGAILDTVWDKYFDSRWCWIYKILQVTYSQATGLKKGSESKP